MMYGDGGPQRSCWGPRGGFGANVNPNPSAPTIPCGWGYWSNGLLRGGNDWHVCAPAHIDLRQLIALTRPSGVKSVSIHPYICIIHAYKAKSNIGAGKLFHRNSSFSQLFHLKIEKYFGHKLIKNPSNIYSSSIF